MPTPIVPPKVNQWINNPQSMGVTGQFPLNLCAALPLDTQKKILLYINQNYVWPQIQERHPFEGMWDAILDMYRIQLRKVDSTIEEASQAGRELKKEPGDTHKVADSVVHDAIERLSDITHFVSFKETLPVQYIIPPYFDNRNADQFYDPMRMRIDTMNSLLQWNFDQEDIYRKHMQMDRHFYLYGCTFAISEFAFETQPSMVMSNSGQQVQQQFFTRLGTTFDPLSIRKLWLNYRLSIYDMEQQPCPFYCDETPQWGIENVRYHPQNNPFGFANLDLLPQPGKTGGDDFMYSGPEMESMRRAIETLLWNIKPGTAQTGGQSIASILKPEHNVSLKWTYFPMLPLDETSQDWLTYQNDDPQRNIKAGDPVPMKRFVVNSFGTNVIGRQTILRIQRNYYPRDTIPIYGCAHLPDLDSGLYTPSIGYLLWNHYKELVTCLSQYIVNKDWINNPPAWVTTSSPAANEDINKPGAKIKVLTPNDFGWRTPFDATQSTAQIMQLIREAAKQTSKSTDALMGQAMGSRTSATEASNAFQASMSAVTTPINLLNHSMMGGYAIRLWEYAAMWMPPDILKALTGQMGFSISPEDMWLRPGVKTNTGSSYIESIVRQQNIQYVLQTGANSPFLNLPEFWKMLLREMKFPNAEELVNDQGQDKQIQLATEQAIKTFLGEPVNISPDQDHSIAIQVKTRFLEDQDSEWMTKYRQNAMKLVQQINIHQQFLMLQLQQQLAHAQAGMPIPGGPQPAGPSMAAAGANPPPVQTPMQNTGAMAQLQGGTVGR